MKPDIFNSFPILSEEDIKAFENKNQIRLPEQYVRFLLKHNGGNPNPGSFKIPRPDLDDTFSKISMFAGIHKGNGDSLARYLITHASRIPNNMLVIARDIFGNVVYISIAGEDFGKIYWWSHEVETSYIISDSFDNFLNGLYSFDDNENDDNFSFR